MDLSEILEHVITGNCTLFTGSGFSFGTQNLLGESPGTAWALTEKMYEACGITESDNDLKNASQFYVETFSEFELIDLLQKNYTIKSVSESHLTIAGLPWKRIYTTNYDNTLELAFTQKGKILTPIVLSERIDQYRDKRVLCIHLNGFINRLTPSSLYNDFKLTDASYLTSDFISSSWVDLFRSDVETSNVILFVGFSLNSDLDLSRIISAHSKKEKLVFIVKPNESKLLIKRLERFGSVFDIGIDGLADALVEKKHSFQPPEQQSPFLQSFVRSPDASLPIKIKDKDIFDLFFKGDANSTFIHHSLNNPTDYKYYINRHQISEIVESIKGGTRNILINADLGNGKTLFLDGLSDRLTSLHYNVYRFQRYYDKTFDEIEHLCRTINKCVIIIEKYSDHFDLLRKLELFRTQETTIIVTERSVINDTTYITLENVIFSSGYVTKELNRLSDPEISDLSDILTTYGLWGQFSSASSSEKRRLITDKCKGSLRLLLLFLLDSPEIKRRFNDILKFIEQANQSFYQATLLILASNIFDFPMDIDKLIYILDDDLLNNPSFHNNDQLREVINFSESKITVRSSILALSLLSQPEYHNALIGLLIKVFKKLDKRSYDKNNYQILKSLISFSRLQGIFNLNENSHFKAVVLNFYEEIKSTNFAAKNPFFWLQYAIARLSSRDYPIADKYFKTAYSYARANDDFDTFQIDNHFARHLLENEVFNGSIETAMEQFIKAHNLLSLKTGTNENRHYPIRVATNYGKFYDRFYKDLSQQDQKVFLVSCNEMMQKITEYKVSVEPARWNRSIFACESELNRIFSKENINS